MNPPDRLVDFSALSGCEPSDRASALPTCAVTVSIGTPATKLVEVVVKNCWCSDGARKPFETEPRTANCGTNA